MSSCRINAAAVLCTLASSVALAGGGDGAVLSPGHNPVLPGFRADPEILFSEATGRYYIYSTTDGTPGWGGHYFKAFSSGNLADWTDEGIVLDLAGPQVAWASGNAWAPAAIECPQPDDTYKYFLYFSGHSPELDRKVIGVAVADDPAGPFYDLVKPVWKRGTKVDPAVAVTTLSADDPDAENTFDRPQRVVPVESQLALAADGTLADSLPANSFRIYEITLIKSN